MNDLATLVSGIEYKIRKLSDQVINLHAEKGSMREEIIQLKEINEILTKKIEQLEEKINLLKLAHPASYTGDEGEAKARIDELLREIDKCIGILSTRG